MSSAKRKRKKMSKDNLRFEIINTIIILVIVIMMLYPFYYILINSFNEGSDTMLGGVFWWPRKFTLENYAYFFKESTWIKSLGVSIVRTILGTGLCVLFTCMVSYGMAKEDLIFRKAYYSIIILAMYFSGGIIPNYILLRSLKLLNTFWVYIIPTALDLFFILIAVNNFQSIPKELLESARLDGAGEAKIFWKIALPVSKPLLATMALFIGVGQWNSWVDSAYYVSNDNLRTLSYRMIEILNQATLPASTYASGMSTSTVTYLSVQMAAMIISTLPIMCVYPFLQKYFVSGMMLGAVKG
jgi:putative aldouronate transport system permease protein